MNVTCSFFNNMKPVAEWLSHAVNKRSRVRILVPPKVLGSDGIICKYILL